MNTPAISKLTAIALGLILAGPATATATPPMVGANHDRVIELVNPPNQTMPVVFAQSSDDGNRIVYRTNGGTDESTFGASAMLYSQRTSAGWNTRSALPPRAAMISDTVVPLGTTPDLREWTYLGTPGLGEEKLSPYRYVRYTPETGAFTPLYTFPVPPVATQRYAMASDDLRHQVAASEELLVAADPSAVGGLYDFGSGEPTLIGLLPGNVAPTCGVPNEGFVTNTTASKSQNWITGDGRRVFFHTQGNDCEAPFGLYMREAGPDGNLGVGGSSTRIDAPALTGDDMGARFARATTDGSEVFYTTASKLDPRDTNDGNDIYRYTVGDGNWCVTCVVADAQVETSGPPPNNEPVSIVVSDEGDYVYFTSKEVLASGAFPGVSNVYRWKRSAPDQLRFVAPAMERLRVTTAAIDATVTPDGTTLVFASRASEINELTDSDNGGVWRFYIYNDDTGDLVCASCPSRTATAGDRNWQAAGVSKMVPVPVITDDGRSFVFASAEALVAGDVNGARDVYEWRDGRVGLITDGRSPSGKRELWGITPDGKSVTFSSTEGLVSGPWNGAVQVYSARIGGGFSEPARPAPCEADACQGSRAPSVPSPAVGSLAVGAGNASSSKRSASVRVSPPKGVVRGSVFVVGVRVPGAGRIVASGSSVRRVVRRLPRAATYRVRLSLTAAAQKTLKRKGRLRVAARVAYVAASGRSSASSVSVTLVAASKGGRR